MARPQLTLYTDVISAFGYLAWHIIHTSPVFRDCDITYVPVLQGGIMQMSNNTPPMNIKNKGEYVDFERQYFVDRFNIPSGNGLPQPFPQNTVYTMRSICALSLIKPEAVNAYTSALFRKFWVDLEPVSKPEVFTAVLKDVLKDESVVQKVLNLVGDAKVKDLLRTNTDEAFQSGAFGAPWFVATNKEGKKQGFWGISHLGIMTEFMRLDSKKDPAFKSML